MLDLERIQRIALRQRPFWQRAIARAYLGPAYRWPPRTKVLVEGRENFVAASKVLAMNHTDRYNYWPFQYWLFRHENRFTATWVKGKYYENRWLGKFMEMTNNIPAPSKGYLMTRDFLATVGRLPDASEYRALRDLSDGRVVPTGTLPECITTRQRMMLGRNFTPRAGAEPDAYRECLSGLLAEMNAHFVELNHEAFRKKLDLLIFPEGTRSLRLSKGRIGLAQAALRFRKGILPIACNGSDKVYPGASPWPKGGTITYRVGEYMPYESFSAYHLPSSVDPFDPNLQPRYRDQMQALVDRVMGRINDLLDPDYQFSHESEEEDKDKGEQSERRFV